MVDALSLELDGSYDLKLRASDGGGITFGTLSGRDEVEQALRIRLRTRLGEDDFAQTTGLPISAMIAANSVTFATGNISRQIAADKRVSGVGNIVLDEDALLRKLTYTATVALIDGAEVSVSGGV